jgi:pyruvate kinase
MVKTKIISTLGPASNNRSVLRKMILSGMDVVRLNFSHGSYQMHGRCIKLINDLNAVYRRHIRILQDLEGFRIRVGVFKGSKEIVLKKHQIAYLAQGGIIGGDNVIPLDYEGSLSDIRRGQHIYIDDGNIALVVKSREKKRLKAEVIVPGILKEHKGVNMPGIKISFPGLTEKDKQDIKFGIAHKVDFIAQSFVRNAKDVHAVRRVIAHSLPHCAIIAKIENREGIRKIDEIIEASDGIMIARGDMGVSLPIYEVPILQKMIIKKCNAKGKFVITATQMLESMSVNLRPTRAEVADVANAILDGTDYVMLSAETAVGKYPAQTVGMMNDIIKFTEQSKLYRKN